MAVKSKAKKAAKPAVKSRAPAAAARKAAPAKGPKYVYLFGKKTDGDGAQKPLLGGKGRQPRGNDAASACPCPPDSPSPRRSAPIIYANKRTYPKELCSRRSRPASPSIERSARQEVRRPGESAAGLRPLRRARLHARHDGHDSQPRPQRPDRARAGPQDQRNERFAWDCYRRFIQMYGDVVMGVQKRPDEDHEPFEMRHRRRSSTSATRIMTIEDTQLTVGRSEGTGEALQGARQGAHRQGISGRSPGSSCRGAIGAVFGSWMNDRAIVYRRKYNIPTEWGTAVNVQAMVYGNTGDNSGSGVAFTRDPATGEKVFYGEFLINAQGEDVVAGVRTPEPVAGPPRSHARGLQGTGAHPPDPGGAFQGRAGLRVHDPGRQVVFMLQTRNGKRTGVAAVRIAVEMVKEKLIDWQTAVTRVPADQLDQVLAPDLRPRRDQGARRHRHAACPPAPARPPARSISTPTAPSRPPHKGEKVLLVRVETSPEDLRGMIAAEGILTARGGVSSHAALVARQMGKVCVCGASALQIDYAAQHADRRRRRRSRKAISSPSTARAGDVYAGEVKTAPSEIIQVLIDDDAEAKKSRTYDNFAQLMKWCAQGDQAPGPHQRRHARAGAPTPSPSARPASACRRTEHMFFEGNRIDAMREMILAEHQGGPRRRPGQAAALPARGLRRHLQGPERPAGHDPVPRSAAARIPAARRSEQQQDLARKLGIARREDHAARARTARVQPDARLPRLPAGHRVSGNHRDAGPRRLRGRRRGARRRASRSSRRS